MQSIITILFDDKLSLKTILNGKKLDIDIIPDVLNNYFIVDRNNNTLATITEGACDTFNLAIENEIYGIDTNVYGGFDLYDSSFVNVAWSIDNVFGGHDVFNNQWEKIFSTQHNVNSEDIVDNSGIVIGNLTENIYGGEHLEFYSSQAIGSIIENNIIDVPDLDLLFSSEIFDLF